jgi:hypothetical protein
MDLRIIIGLLLVICILYSLAVPLFDCKEGFLVGTTGIAKVCIAGTSTANCYDISYIDSTTGLNKQVSAQISPGYYIDVSGYLASVPYGYTADANMRSYKPSSKTALYEAKSLEKTNKDIDAKIKELEAKIAGTPVPLTLKTLQDEIERLKQQKINVMDTDKTSNKQYNSDNLDITYHADTVESPDESTAGAGKMWVKIDGNLVAVPYSDVSNTTLYYSSGDYIYNSASYVPNYEESVFLSKLTNQPTVSKVVQQPVNKAGFCTSAFSVQEKEAKCNALDKNVCASTDCCVLLGGEKCVAGTQSGPSIKSNYSDLTIINRDYYYYHGECYGHC